MQSVSNEYNNAMNSAVRNIAWVQIALGLISTTASDEAIFADNGHLPWSSLDYLTSTLPVSNSYATLEHNRWILNSEQKLPVLSEDLRSGFIGDEISNQDGRWKKLPEIIVTLKNYYELPALSFSFDEQLDNYPEKINVRLLHDNDEVYNQEITVDSSFFTIEQEFPTCNKIFITFLKFKIPHRRARLSSFAFGLYATFDSESIDSCKSAKAFDILSTEYPLNDFSFTILDTNRSYDPENPNSLWRFIESRQPVSARIGITLDNGKIYWQPWLQAYTTGEVTVNSSQLATKLSFKSSGLIEHLTRQYENALYYSSGRSLYDLAQDVIKDTEYEDAVIIDDVLKQTTTRVPLPNAPVNTLLQLIANAGCCVMTHDRTGALHIKKDALDEQSFAMSFDKITDFPQTNKTPILRSISIKYHVPQINSTKETIVNEQQISIVGTAFEDITFYHDPFINVTATVSGELKTNGTKTYVNKTVVTLSGSGTITLTGNKVVITDIDYTQTFNELGEDLITMDNQLIDSYENAQKYVNWIASCVQRRNKYSASDRGWPELDIGDVITFTSNFLSEIQVEVTKQEISYNGAISGNGEYIIKNER